MLCLILYDNDNPGFEIIADTILDFSNVNTFLSYPYFFNNTVHEWHE